MSLSFPTAEEMARLSARMLLEIKAVHFSAEPFTYASGLKGPTYIDCRKLISHPRIRSTLMDFMAATVCRDAGFEAFDNIAGGETAGIPFAAMVAERLGLDQDEWLVTFQSRFGREQWLTPYTDETLEGLARQGVRQVDLICPGFSADCVETLEENAIQNRALFEQAGGERLSYIPCLNDAPDHIAFLTELILRHLRPWLPQSAAG